ncbi:hypothetical protein Ddye_018238 [Dipteronia dyeriana]|uniref:Uncharacterized protein n=1 Tax=Dipteronia dyeriana TaxID=168575 RepID=A0AAD9UB09_9ROSI|nr:hypothetical protein Ddye_018238 [Dipteronia dyeriana]
MDFLPRDQKQGEHVRDLPTATKLHGSGVKFKGIEGGSSGVKFKKGIEGGSSGFKFKKGIEGGSSRKISCELVPRAIPIPYFKACELRIPCLEIDDWSECLYRNMMAFELCHYPTETHICNFMLLMNFLINTEKDVDLLVDQKIICSRMGDNATVATMFNNLGLQITPSPSVYHDIYEKLKAHYNGRWNRTMANLKTIYFGDIWKSTATGAAIILLVLTVVQTIFSIVTFVAN